MAGCNGTIGTPTSTPSVAPAPAATPSIVNDLWRPEVGVTWQWQLTDAPVDTSIDADVYDVDLFETDAATVRRLHDLGRRVICYVNAGGWEDWRGDADAFPAVVIGGA
ncbi:MAG: endo alpha-1,4 polygalactosaminidase, partial [Chloroflexi bacterium]|nr:endo alpha-1,4 polygalactosaminidase [Chloroflexota bacterium]